MAHIQLKVQWWSSNSRSWSIFLFTTTQVELNFHRKRGNRCPHCPLTHIFHFQSCQASGKKTKGDKVILSHVHFPSFSWCPLIDLDFINSSAKCCVNARADQSHASLTFNSQILLTAWSGGHPLTPPALICPTHSSKVPYLDSALD